MLNTPEDWIARYRHAFNLAHGKVAPRIVWNGTHYVWPPASDLPPATQEQFVDMFKRVCEIARYNGAFRKS